MRIISKRLTKRAIQDIAEAISGEVPDTFTEEALRRISAATFVDCMAFTEMLQQHKEDFSSLLQHMADCYKALIADESSCVSASAAISYTSTYPANEFKNIHAFIVYSSAALYLFKSFNMLEWI